jgi:hypothetical protein
MSDHADTMTAEVTEGIEYGTDYPCQVGRIVYREGVHTYIALVFRTTEPLSDWRLSWVGIEGGDTARLPKGIAPSPEMLSALEVAS